eukprot:TRINITY_DN8707_c0_g1_i4.p1 TRINITY_DN8707_c0_g1~~TRINITY_DN8707_c0_g1_i4.p1  ORF type:complete len:391 (+),score=46.17 TRINITY_DN8707_c0_g1_i4:72-1244(+)
MCIRDRYHTMTYLSIAINPEPSRNFDAISSMYQHARAELCRIAGLEESVQTPGQDVSPAEAAVTDDPLTLLVRDLSRFIQSRLSAIQIYQELAGSSVAPDLELIQTRWCSIRGGLCEHEPHRLLTRLYTLSRFEIDSIDYYMQSMLAIGRCDFKDAVINSYCCKSQLARWRQLIAVSYSPEQSVSRLFSWVQKAHKALLAKITLYFSEFLKQQAETQARGNFHTLALRCTPDFTEQIDNFGTHADVSVLLVREIPEGSASLQYSCSGTRSTCSGLQQWPIIFSSSHRAPSHWEDHSHLPNIVSLVASSQQLSSPHLQCAVCHHEPALGVSYCLAQVEAQVILAVISSGKLDPDDHVSIQDFMRWMLIQLRHLNVYAQLRSNSVSNTPTKP